MCTFKNVEEIWKTWKKFEKPGKNLKKRVATLILKVSRKL